MGGTIRATGTSAAQSIEPHSSTGIYLSGAMSAAMCYSTLLTFKWGPDVTPPAYTPQGDLAESWTQADDLTYVFKLRPGIKFHNITPVSGRELTAQDIIYSYERIRQKRSYASLLASIAKMEAVDPSTLKLTLAQPDADILDNLAQNTLPVVPHERDEMSGGNLDEPPLIGSGGFLLDSFVKGQGFKTKRNPDYYIKGRPYVDGIELTGVGSDPSLLINTLRAGTADIAVSGLTIQLAEDLKKSMPTANIQYPLADRSIPRLTLNVAQDLFKDARVRQAISKAIDRKAMSDSIFLGRARFGTGLSLPDPSWALPQADVDRFATRDVAAARQLLSQAGVSNLSFEIIVTTALSGTFVTMAELIQANLKDIGITTTLKSVDGTTWSAALTSSNFQALVGTVSGGAINGVLGAQYRSGGSQNYIKYSDPELDKLIDQQAVMAKDPEGRKKAVLEIQRKLLNDLPYIPLLQYPASYAHLPEIKGYYPQTGGGFHNLLWTTVWLDK
jgi:ABC-type transport system substrate-binding protein